MEAFLQVVRDLALLAARVVTGITLISHGWYRWTVTGLEEQVNLLETVGLPSSEGLVIATIAFELIGGALLIFGLGTPLVGLGMVIQNAAVVLTTRAEAGIYQHDGGWEYNAILAVLGLLFLTLGSGRLGIDHLFLRPRDDGAAAARPLIASDPRDRRPTAYPMPETNAQHHSEHTATP